MCKDCTTIHYSIYPAIMFIDTEQVHSTFTTVAETQINIISVLNKWAGNILTSNSGCWQLTGIFIEK